MMISICAASALFAEDNNYYLANDNGVLKQVEKQNGVYKFVGTNKVVSGDIFILAKVKDTGDNTGSMFMGEGAKTSLWNSLAIGYNANAKEFNATALGSYTIANNNAVAIGPGAQALGGNSIAIGYESQATDTDAIAIGQKAQAKINNAIAIGQNSKAEKDYDVAFGVGANASGQFSQAIGTSAESKGSYSNAIGYEAKALGENVLAFGYEAEAKALDSIALGTKSKASENSNAIGYHSFAWGKNSIAIGGSDSGSQASYGEGSIAIGSSAFTLNDHSIAIGSSAVVLGNGYSIAIGNQSQAEKEYTIAIGSNAKAKENNSVALGSNSVADIKGKMAGFDFVTGKESKDLSPTWRSTSGAISIGDKANNITRQITNVAAGTKDTDAVNVAQLKSLREYTDKGFHTQADYNVTDITKGNVVFHKLGGVIKISGNFKPLDGTALSIANMNKYLSGENLATSIEKDGSINLLMAKTPKFDDIYISKNGKGGKILKTIQA